MPILDGSLVTSSLVPKRRQDRRRSERRNLPHAVYRMFADDGMLLYIGCTYNVPVRLRGHIAWLPQVASITLEWHANADDGLAAETRVIKAENPLYNVKDTPKAKPAEYVRQQYLVSADAGKERYNRPVEPGDA